MGRPLRKKELLTKKQQLHPGNGPEGMTVKMGYQVLPLLALAVEVVEEVAEEKIEVVEASK